MKAKDKALYLAGKFPSVGIAEDCIDEILQELTEYGDNQEYKIDYWLDVKREIQKFK